MCIRDRYQRRVRGASILDQMSIRSRFVWLSDRIDRWAEHFLLNAPTDKASLYAKWEHQIQQANEEGRKLWALGVWAIMATVMSFWDPILVILVSVIVPLALLTRSGANFVKFGWLVHHALLGLFAVRMIVPNTQPSRKEVMAPDITGMFFWVVFLFVWNEVSNTRFSTLLIKHFAANLVVNLLAGVRLAVIAPTVSIFMLFAFCYRRNLGADIADKMVAMIATEKLHQSQIEARFLRRVSDSKSVFLRTLCHELRNPMTAVQGNNEILVRKLSQFAERSQREMSPEVKLELCDALIDDLPKMLRFGSNALLSSKHMSDVLNETLTAAKYEAEEAGGASPSDETVVCIRQCFQTVISMFQVIADRKGIGLKLVIPPEEDDLIVKMHQSCVKQNVINLLGNALKFTDKGAVVVSVQIARGPDEETRLVCSVADTGIGMSPDEQSKLFVPFSQANAEIGDKYGGSGLGLDIVQRSLQDLGGTVRLESVQGKGSTFTFELPVELLPSDSEKQPSAHSSGSAASRTAVNKAARVVSHQKRSVFGVPLEDFAESPDSGPVEISQRRQRRKSRGVLIVDDDSRVRDVLREQLVSMLDCRVTAASNGSEAVQIVEGTVFDLIIMDINMPVLGGLDATKAIRAGSTKNASTPIVGFSANSLEADLELAKNVGMDAYLTKPYRLAELCETVSEFTEATYVRDGRWRGSVTPGGGG
eukprot:TRINITY_DN2253_c0_g1_i1.p1 TRINITY_DN2253_c0_g1~~TRINITY_DN2253_c0_g1_i1.p1  ORF type:complete len:706 (+),score=122.89 TRINITY_DN2253_c0_g1_i1:87-2204(+)